MKIRSLSFAILICSIGIAWAQCPSYSQTNIQNGTCSESKGDVLLQGKGPIILTVNGTLTINGDLSVIGETLIVTGELTVIGAFNVGQGSSVIVKNGGIVSVVSMVSGFGSSLTVENGGSLAIAQNAGSGLYAAFDVDFGASVYVGGSFVSGGIGLSAIDGDMRVDGDFTNTGGGVMEGNGVLMVGGSYIDNGDASHYSGIYNGRLLPVEFSRFSTEVNRRQVTLKWQTEMVQNSYGFEVERSKDGEVFKSVGWVPSRVNADRNTYDFLDINPIRRVTYYRLRKVKYDGHYAYSSIIRVDKNGASSLLAEASDPMIDQIRSVNEIAEFQLYNEAGKLLLERKNIIRKEAEALIAQQIENGPVGVYTLNARIGKSTDEIQLVKE